MKPFAICDDLIKCIALIKILLKGPREFLIHVGLDTSKEHFHRLQKENVMQTGIIL